MNSCLDTGSETAVFSKNSKYQGRKSQRIGTNTTPSGDEIKKQKMKQSLEMYMQNIKRAQTEPLVFSNFDDLNHTSKENSTLFEQKCIPKSNDKTEKSDLMTEITNNNEINEKNEKNEKSGKSGGIDISSLTLINLYKNSGNCVRLRVNGTLVPSYLLRRYARTPGRIQSISSFPDPPFTSPRKFSSSSSTSSSSSSSTSTSPLIYETYQNSNNESKNPNKITTKNKNEIVPKGAFFLESCWALCKKGCTLIFSYVL